MFKLFLVGLGGFVGSILRYVTSAFMTLLIYSIFQNLNLNFLKHFKLQQ